MLVIFDIDGTICDSQKTEGICYSEAIEHVTGHSLSTLDWRKYPEPTSSAIVQNLLRELGFADVKDKEAEIEREFVVRLQAACALCRDEFSPIPGAPEFIRRLKEGGEFTVAIATGCFDLSARFKLKCCGIDADDFPFASSSDTPARRDILPLVAQKAGAALESVVYFGDAAWDLKVSHALDIPLVGIGRGHEYLRSQGIADTFRDYLDDEAVLAALRRIKEKAPVHKRQ